MKKQLSIVLSGVILLGLAGCSGVAQSDYDAVVSKNESLTSEVARLTTRLVDLQNDYNNLEKINDTNDYFQAADSSGKFDYSNGAASFNYDKSVTTLMEIGDADSFSDAVVLYPNALSGNVSDDDFLKSHTQMTAAKMKIDSMTALLLIAGDEESLNELATGLFGVSESDIVYTKILEGELFEGPVIFRSELSDGRKGNVKILKNESGVLSMVVAVLNDDAPEEQVKAISLAFDSAE